MENIDLNDSEENAWNFEWKFSPTFSKVMDKDHRITPLQQSDEKVTFLLVQVLHHFQFDYGEIYRKKIGLLKLDFDKTI